MVKSHDWLHFRPVNTELEPGFDEDHLIRRAFRTPACDDTFPHVGFPVICTNISPSARPTSTRIVTPWLRDDWRSKITSSNHDHLHRVLRHPQTTSILNLFRQKREGRKIPRQIREYIEKQQKECRPCAQHAELSRVPKLAIPPPISPNIAINLDVMPHYIKSTQRQILVILNAGDMMI